MLLLMIGFVAHFLPDWMFKPMNENPHLGTVQPRVCKIVEDNSPTTLSPRTWIKNNRMTCENN